MMGLDDTDRYCQDCGEVLDYDENNACYVCTCSLPKETLPDVYEYLEYSYNIRINDGYLLMDDEE